MKDGGDERPKHSPLGASSAERWVACPGSIALLGKFSMPETDEPDYAREGTAAHELLAKCLMEDLEPWEFLGQSFHETEATSEMTDAVQIAVDHVRSLITPIAKTFFEYPISSPIHPQFYGTLDVGIVYDSIIHIVDFKYGKGIVVEADHNKQLMYYAYGLVQHYPEVRKVVLHIMQPRAFHADGVIRKWSISAEDLCLWVGEELVPAMHRAGTDETLMAGTHCRFCPAKLVCPLLSSLFGTAATYNAKEIPNLNSEALGRSYQYIPAVKHYMKALEDEAFRRARKGEACAGTKLVHKKGNRVYRPGAEAIFAAKFGDEAYSPRSLKGPFEMEKLSPVAKALVHENAFTPTTDLTLALATDPRPAVKPQTAMEVFAGAAATLETE
jgi:hypothetical protein